MSSKLEEIFDDFELVGKVKRRLPHLFHYAERDSSRAGRVGMEVGSLRERILVSLMVYRFGRPNVETDLPITEHDVDVRLFGKAISIKSVTTKTARIGTVKAIWTVDAERAQEFVLQFEPTSDYLLAHLVWDQVGGLYYVPVEVQKEVLSLMGREDYFKLPKLGTNPRGVEIRRESMEQLVSHRETRMIEIEWTKPSGEYDPFARWIEYWELD